MANLILQEGLSFVRYEADGTTNAYGITFDYLTSADIKAFVNGSPATYTYINASEIALDTPAESGDNVVINRVVKNDARYVNFQDGGQIREKTLDLNSDQIFFMAQEAIDTAGLNLFVSPITGTIDMKGSRVINMGEPIDDTDGMTFGSSKAAVASCAASALAAATSASDALSYKNLAQGYMNNAMDAASSAGAASVNATTAAGTASTQAGLASVSATNAASSASSAASSASTASTQANNASLRAIDASNAADAAVESANEAETAMNNSISARDAAITARNESEGFRDEAEDFAMAASASIGNPTGAIVPYLGTSAPLGYLLCDGRRVSRTTYAALFAVIGTSSGAGDGSTTFNLPDFRGQFLRGRVALTNPTGSGTASSNQATFTNHGINRTGFRVRLSSGTLTGLAASTNYYAIVVDDNTLAFATTRANAMANTRIAISGTNTAVIQQWEDVDASARQASSVGGNTGTNVGSIQEDAFQGHKHGMAEQSGWGSGVNSVSTMISGWGSPPLTGSSLQGMAVSDGTNGTPRTAGETRPSNVTVNFIIKY